MSDLNKKNIQNPQSVEDFLNFAVNSFNLPRLAGEGREVEKMFENPKLESEMLLSFALKKDRVWLKTHPDYILSDQEAAKSREIIERRKNHEPLAYIRGWKMWCDMKIKVSPDVLIPRDETEILANYILENKSGLMSSRTHPSPDLNFSRLPTAVGDFEVKTILDIGAGSGCLAVFCAKKFPNAKITAIDICPKALKIARENAETQKVKINFIESDLLSFCPHPNPLPKGEGVKRTFDIIIANLPYVPENIEITKDVAKEPYNAIFSGEDGLDLIRKLAEELKSREISFHELWLEFWTAQEDEIRKIFAGFDIEFLPDLSGDTYFAKITPKK